MAKFNIESLLTFGQLLKELSIGLRNLTLEENFRSFEADIVIPATSELQIRNQLTVIPTRYIIVSQTGNGLITKSSSNEWTINNIYLYNNGAEEVTIKIIFLR